MKTCEKSRGKSRTRDRGHSRENSKVNDIHDVLTKELSSKKGRTPAPSTPSLDPPLKTNPIWSNPAKERQVDYLHLP